MQIFNPRMSKRKVETTSSIKAQKSVDDSSLHAETEANNFLETAQKAIDFAFSPIVVLPGDDVTSHITKTTKKLLLGAGLKMAGNDKVICTNAGVLRYRPANRYWIDYNYKRYIPSLGDGVIGIVSDRNAEFYRVNISASSSATLGVLAFDGASKRNRPNIRIGSLVYARISKTNKDIEPELTCEAPANTTKKDWMTGLALYGELNDGYVFKTSIALAKNLLRDDCFVLPAIGKLIPFEIAIGINGIVWVNSKTTRNTTIIANAILNSESMTESEVNVMVAQLTENADLE